MDSKQLHEMFGLGEGNANVWSLVEKLSPAEQQAFVRSFSSPTVKAYLKATVVKNVEQVTLARVMLIDLVLKLTRGENENPEGLGSMEIVFVLAGILSTFKELMKEEIISQTSNKIVGAQIFDAVYYTVKSFADEIGEATVADFKRETGKE